MTDALLDFSLEAMHATACAWCLDPACSGSPCKHTTEVAEQDREIGRLIIGEPPPYVDLSIAEQITKDYVALLRSEDERWEATKERALDVLSRAPSAPTIDHAEYLGASDVAAILGLDAMRTPLDVWAEKRRELAREASEEMEAGNDHEAAVVAGARRRLQRAGLADVVEHPGPGTVIVREPGGLVRGATLDAVVHLHEHGPCALEAKYVGFGQSDAWGPDVATVTVRDELPCVPDRVIVQVHWQTLHLRERFGHHAPVAMVAADVAGTDRRLYTVEIDDDTIAALLEAMRTWWAAHIVGGEMPQPNERDVRLLARVHRAQHSIVEMRPREQVQRLAEQYAMERETLQRMHSLHDLTTARLMHELGSDEGYVWWDGDVRWRVTWRGEPRVLRVSRRERPRR